MIIESHKDQNSLFTFPRHENKTNDKNLKKNKTREGENINEKNVNVTTKM